MIKQTRRRRHGEKSPKRQRLHQVKPRVESFSSVSRPKKRDKSNITVTSLGASSCKPVSEVGVRTESHFKQLVKKFQNVYKVTGLNSPPRGASNMFNNDEKEETIVTLKPTKKKKRRKKTTRAASKTSIKS